MPTWIALIRAINLGPHKKLPMAELRVVLDGLGYARARTLLASGNAIFEAPTHEAGTLERDIEAAIDGRFGLSTDVLVRDAEQWARMIDDNPFAQAAEQDPAHLVMMPLKAEPTTEQIAALKAALPGREQAEVTSATCYLTYPDGIGESRLTAAVIERKLGARGTGRNWNTVLKIRSAMK